MKFLKQIKEDKVYIEEVAKLIQDHFYQTIFKPLFDILDIKQIAKERHNSGATDFRPIASAIVKHITSGSIWYEDGGFAGTFNAVISKWLRSIGARYDTKSKKFKIALEKIPVDIKNVINAVKIKEAAKAQSAIDYVDRLKDTKLVDIKVVAKKIVEDLEAKITYTMPKDMTIPMELTRYQQERITEQYSENMNLYIQKWKKEEIIKLRGKVQENVASGFRASKLSDDIQRQYGVSKSKANFLAQQETQLMTAKYTQGRYIDAGLRKYRWRTMGDNHVRKQHAHLNGGVFSFDNPPIIDLATGEKGNPREGYNCRCWAEVIIE